MRDMAHNQGMLTKAIIHASTFGLLHAAIHLVEQVTGLNEGPRVMGPVVAQDQNKHSTEVLISCETHSRAGAESHNSIPMCVARTRERLVSCYLDPSVATKVFW